MDRALKLNKLIYSLLALAMSQVFASAPALAKNLGGKGGVRCSLLNSSEPKSDGKLAAGSPRSEPKKIRLYPDGKISNTYTADLNNLVPGDIIDFGNKDIFTVREILGSRGETLIVDVGEDAIRIPIDSEGYFGNTVGSREFEANSTDFYELYDQMADNGVQTVKVDKLRSRPPRFVRVQKLDLAFTITSFFKADFNSKEMKEILQKFYKFAESMWLYEAMADFDGTQAGYDKISKQWVLFDWSRNRRKEINLVNLASEKTVFDSILWKDGADKWTEKFIPDKVLKKVTEKILAKRRAAQNGSWIQRKEGRTDPGDNFLFHSLTREPLPPGEILETHRFNPFDISYDDAIQARNESERIAHNKVLKIISKIEDEGPFSVYKVDIQKQGMGYLKILKVNGKKSVAYLEDEIKLQRKGKQGRDPSKYIDSGKDFILVLK